VLTLAALPWTAAQRAPRAAALLTNRGSLDFRSLDRAAAAVAARLARRGIEPGHRVAICCGNGLAFPVLYYGALRQQAVVALLPPAAPVADMAATIRRLRIRLVATEAAHAQRVRAALRQAATGATCLSVRDSTSSNTDGTPGRQAGLDLDTLVDHRSIAAPKPVPASTPAVILNTSGTTGTPRAALHSHGSLLLNARAVAGEMLGLGESDVQLGALPLPHSFGMSAVLNASVLAGAGVALMHEFDAAAALQAIAAHRVTVLQAVPTMFSRLAAAANAGAASTRPATLRLAVVSGAPLPANVATAVHDALCTTVIERYGMTEVSPLTMRRVPRDGGEPGDVGRPLWGVGIRVVGGGSSGELEAMAPSMFLGYAGDRRATREALVDGFFRTGDLGRVHPEGRVILTGRLKDLIIRGGYNVAAREVEHLLESHPAVAEVAVVGLPDPDLGEEVAAALVLRHPHTSPSAAALAADLRRRCTEQLAGYKRPRRWYVLDELPRTASGKVRKSELRDVLLDCTSVLSEQ
jgi:long-chain acyl-CoA synthetase